MTRSQRTSNIRQVGPSHSPVMDARPLWMRGSQAALESPGGMKLFTGRGDEPDTIGDKAVLVYDSNKFPFYPAELYHQFHNDFMGPSCALLPHRPAALPMRLSSPSLAHSSPDGTVVRTLI